jgi:ATP-binding cassette subfamily F protein uup
LTNDLDVDTIEAVEAMLSTFDGVVLMTGHDRAFMDTLAQHIFVFEGDGAVSDWQGTYSELRVAQKAREAAGAKAAQKAQSGGGAAAAAAAAAAAETAPAAARDPEARRVANNAKNKISKVEAQLEKVEAAIAALDEQLVAACADAGKAMELADKRAKAVTQQEELYAEYERLDALVAAGGLS